MSLNNQLARHSRAGGNPARANNSRSEQNEPPAASFEERPNYNIVQLRGRFFIHLDSRQHGNDVGLCAEMAV